MSESYKVMITWTSEDIKKLKPNWSLEKCEDFLETVGSDLEDSSISHGWDFLEMMLKEGDF